MAESVLEKLIKMEDKYALFDLKCGDFSPWGYIRWEIYTGLEIEFGEVSGTHFGSTFAEKLKKTVDAYRTTRGKRDAIPARLLFVSHPRRFLIDGKYKCIYTDELADMYGEDVCVIENGYVHSAPVYTERIYYPDNAVISETIQELIYGRIGDRLLKKDEKKALYASANMIANALKEVFGISYETDRLYKKSVKNFILYNRNTKRAEKILDAVKPKIIVEVVGYTALNMALNEVANKRGIPTVELQHGVIGSGHFAYNYLKRYSLSYFPKYMLLWGEYWRDTARFPQDNDKIFSCGYPYFENKISEYDKNKGRENAIVVLSQPIVADIIADKVIEFAKLMEDSGEEYKLYYKLHPSEYDIAYEFLPRLQRSGIEIIRDNSITVYELFSKATAQIGAFSTAIYEGMDFGLKTYIIDTPKAEAYMGDLYKNGYAVLVKSGRELYEAYKEGTNGQNERFDEEKFFKKDAKNNIRECIECIMT